ncbi:MAG: LIC12162 family protein [Candidatus Omnitrophota bacterium]|jgi:putative transferase (TIGR04331 family)
MKYYLATTAISDIWDEERELLVLGPWCLTGTGRKKILRYKNYTIIDSPWRPSFRVKEAEDYCRALYEKTMPLLSKAMNSIHGVDHPDRYWRILVGPWLVFFIEVFYDRYRRIENAIALYPDLYTHTIPAEGINIACNDMRDFLAAKGGAIDDFYNLKLFSHIVHNLCPERSVNIDIKNAVEDVKTDVEKQGFKAVMENVLKNIKMLFRSPSVILTDMYHIAPSQSYALMAGSRGRVMFGNFKQTPRADLSGAYSAEIREKIGLGRGQDAFHELLCRTIPLAIPSCYVEDYKIYKSNVGAKRPVKYIGSAVGWYFNDIFKFFAAESLLGGATLLDFQHGGGYGVSLSFPAEGISMEKDIFYTWGWVADDGKKTKPLPSPYLSRLKNSHKPVDNSILFVSNSIYKYHVGFHSFLSPDDMPKYHEDKKIFFNSLDKRLLDKVIYRPYPIDRWEELEALKRSIPRLKLLQSSKLVDKMKGSRLVVIDHLSTPFIEALTINVPCICFWDHDVTLIRPKANKYFEMMREAGILYDNPRDAARRVNEIYDNVESWWRGDKIQMLKDELCSKFALTSGDWLAEWKEELCSRE